MNTSPSPGPTDHPIRRPGRQRRAGAWAWLLGVPALALLATTAAVCGDGSGRTPLSIAGATATPAGATPRAGTPAPADVTPTPGVTPTTPLAPVPTHVPAGIQMPPIQSRALPDDRTGDLAWDEVNYGGAWFRVPTDDRQWEVYVGGGGDGFAGVPHVRVTNLSTGQARHFSLLDGSLLLCTNRAAVLARPAVTGMENQGVPVDCSQQVLTQQERDVFGNIRFSAGWNQYYEGPLPDQTTFPGVVLPTALPHTAVPGTAVTP